MSVPPHCLTYCWYITHTAGISKFNRDRTGLTPAAWINESPLLLMDMDCYGGGHGGIGFLSGGYGVPNLTDINAEGLSNVFSSPRNTPYYSTAQHQQHHHHNHVKRDPDDDVDYLKMGSSVPGGGNITDDNNNNNMYIHYNNSYQPHHQCNDHHAVHRMSGVYPDDRLYCGPGVHSPTTRDNDHDHCNHDSLSVLADTFIASAEKDRRQEDIMSLFAAKPSSSSSSQVGMMTIYSSEQEDYNNNNYQGNTTVGELSQIIKSDDSPTTSLQDGDQLVDVSFSTLADLSMLRTTSSPPSCANHLSTNGALIGMNHNIVQLSPIAAKSPDISMTPYLNCLTLDCSSQGSSRPSDTNNNNHHHHHTLNALNDAAFNALNPLSSSTSEPMPQQHEQEHEPPNLSRSLFSSTTSSKRKRASIHDYNSSSSSAGDADLLDLTNVAPFSNDAAFVSMR